MFFVEDDWVKLSNGRAEVCPVESIPRAIRELTLLQEASFNSPAVAEAEIEEDRYTHEGIDRYYKADSHFRPSKERWEADAPLNWANLTGPELFQYYQKHAECYCEGCREYQSEPTYEGFRLFLIRLRDFQEPL